MEYTTRAELLQKLACSDKGLTHAEAASRRQQYGSNEISFHHGRSSLRILLEEITALFPLLLLAASALAVFAHFLSPDEGYGLIAGALLFVVVLNTMVSYIQNVKVEKQMVSFLDYIPKEVVLLRDNERVMLEAKEVVPGDVLFIQEGDKISADGVLLEAENLLLDESILTGESEPVERVAASDEITPDSMVSSGATVFNGHGAVLVTRIGRKTGLGSISQLSQGVEQDLTPMQKELKDFVRKITWIALGLGGLFFVAGFFIGNTFWTNLIFAIGIIVANVPEGLLPTVTLALSQSSMRMGKRNALIKHILSVETLGSTSVICTDKTGTLTRNRLHVERSYLDFTELDAADVEGLANNPAANTLLEIMALCNDIIEVENGNGSERFKGDPTETALAEFVERESDFDTLRAHFELLEEHAFDPNYKYMWSLHATEGDTRYLTVKGAPEVVLEHCSAVHNEGEVRELTEDERAQLVATANHYAAEGLRVLSLAYRVLEADAGPEVEQMVFVGHVALVDPPRDEVPAAVAACKSAGMHHRYQR